MNHRPASTVQSDGEKVNNLHYLVAFGFMFIRNPEDKVLSFHLPVANGETADDDIIGAQFLLPQKGGGGSAAASQ